MDIAIKTQERIDWDLNVNAITPMIANDLTGNFSSSHKKDNNRLFAIENQQASNILLPKNDWIL